MTEQQAPTDMTPDEMIEAKNRCVSSEEIEGVVTALKEVANRARLSGVMVTLMGMPDERGAAGYNVAGVGADTTLINCAFSTIQHVMELYPKRKPQIVSYLLKIASEAQTSANAN